MVDLYRRAVEPYLYLLAPIYRASSAVYLVSTRVFLRVLYLDGKAYFRQGYRTLPTALPLYFPSTFLQRAPLLSIDLSS